MNWQISILQFLESLRGETLTKIFEMITFTGEGVLMPGIILIIYWCINKMVGLKLGFIMVFSIVGNGFIKNIVKAARPFESGVVVALREHTATGYSFPSGHTQGVTTFWAALMIQLKEKWVYLLGGAMIALVALSRLYLGVHWPIDVIAAIVIGTVFTMVGCYLFERLQKVKILWLLLSCVIMAATLGLGFDSGYTKILGGMIGLIIGMILEQRYISFTTEGSFKHQVFKVTLGLGGLLVVAGALKGILPRLMIFDFIRYMVIAIWVVAGAPYMFTKIFKYK